MLEPLRGGLQKLEHVLVNKLKDQVELSLPPESLEELHDVLMLRHLPEVHA